LGIVTAALVVVWKPAVGPQTADNRWAALAVVLTGAALVLALIGTGIAVSAYFNAIEGPRLLVHPEWDLVSAELPPEAGRTPDTEGWRAWFTLNLRLLNTGHVSARFIAIRVGLVGATFERDPNRPQADDAHFSWRFMARTEITEVQWEGGANVVVHPRFGLYTVPEFGGWIVGTQPTLKLSVYVVADKDRRRLPPRILHLHAPTKAP
jgi:hypothetical protein